MKKLLLSLVLLLSLGSYAATKLPPVPAFTAADSLQIVQLAWSEKTIAPGVVYKEVSDPQLFNKAAQHICIVEIDPQKSGLGIHFGYTEKCTLTSEMATQLNALAAVNGSYFNVKEEFPVNYLKLDGKALFPTTKSEAKTRATGAILIDKGRVSLEPWNLSIEAKGGYPAENIMVSGPLLVYKNKCVTLPATAFELYRHPRTAFGITKKGTWIFFVVDGRFSNISEGMNLYEMAYFAKISGYSDFINLDGGGSTTLWIKDQGATGVMNNPCDNHKYDHKGERKVSNIVYIK